MADEPIPYFDNIYRGMSFDDALALKTEIEADPSYHVHAVTERPFPYNRGKWTLNVSFHLQQDGRTKYGRFMRIIASREDWLLMQEGATQRVATQEAKASEQRKKG